MAPRNTDDTTAEAAEEFIDHDDYLDYLADDHDDHISFGVIVYDCPACANLTAAEYAATVAPAYADAHDGPACATDAATVSAPG
jgi:hypothetical protein